MGLILAIYTNDAYQEVHLPQIDNADYDLWLRAKEYGIKKDLHLFMEVLEQQWRFKRSEQYEVLDARGSFRDKALVAGQILQIQAENKRTTLTTDEINFFKEFMKETGFLASNRNLKKEYAAA